MRPLYESLQDDFEIYERQSVHFSPQIHNFVECFYITQGTFELGLDQHLYHMEAGDFAIIFPGTIHHSQVFDPGPCTNIDMLFSTSYTGVFSDTLLQNRQIDPVIRAKDLHPDVPYAIHSLFQDKQAGKLSQVLVQSWVQIILTRCMAVYKLEPRSATVNNDLIFRSVSYIAALRRAHHADKDGKGSVRLPLCDLPDVLRDLPHELQRVPERHED